MNLQNNELIKRKFWKSILLVSQKNRTTLFYNVLYCFCFVTTAMVCSCFFFFIFQRSRHGRRAIRRHLDVSHDAAGRFALWPFTSCCRRQPTDCGRDCGGCIDEQWAPRGRQCYTWTTAEGSGCHSQQAIGCQVRQQLMDISYICVVLFNLLIDSH